MWKTGRAAKIEQVGQVGPSPASPAPYNGGFGDKEYVVSILDDLAFGSTYLGASGASLPVHAFTNIEAVTAISSEGN